jgi:hypothetical protein
VSSQHQSSGDAVMCASSSAVHLPKFAIYGDRCMRNQHLPVRLLVLLAITSRPRGPEGEMKLDNGAAKSAIAR